ncbi:hypothetical protein M569_16057, partial [Genlisea aurea]
KRKMRFRRQTCSEGEQSIEYSPRSSCIEWRSELQQKIYSSKLLHALRQVRGLGNSTGQKRVHETADRLLAARARGRTNWSQSILKNKLALRSIKKKKTSANQHRRMMAAITGSKKKIAQSKSQSVPSFQRKARFLSRLIPGCRKQPLPVVLEEATDYIPALEMQVRAMRALAELLS